MQILVSVVVVVDVVVVVMVVRMLVVLPGVVRPVLSLGWSVFVLVVTE